MAGVELLDGVRSLARDEWNALVGEESPFLEWEWLASLEEGGCGGDRDRLGAAPARDPRGRAPRRGLPALREGATARASSSSTGAGRTPRSAPASTYYPKLLVGVPFTPVTGARLLTAPGADRARRASTQLARGAAASSAVANELSGVHVNFCRERRAQRARGRRLPPAPRLPVPLDERRASRRFDDYLGALRSKRRNQMRRERRELDEQGVAHRGDHRRRDPRRALRADVPHLPRDGRRSTPGAGSYLNARVLRAAARALPRAALLRGGAGAASEIVAGTVNVAEGRRALRPLLGRAASRSATCTSTSATTPASSTASSAGCARFEPGAGGEYKQLRGFDAAPTWSFHYLADPALRRAVERFLERERAETGHAIEWYRAHSANRRDAARESSRRGRR